MPRTVGYINRDAGWLRQGDTYPLRFKRQRPELTTEQRIARLRNPDNIELLYSEPFPRGKRRTVRVTEVKRKHEDSTCFISGQLIIGFLKGRAQSTEPFTGEFNLETGMGWITPTPSSGEL